MQQPSFIRHDKTTSVAICAAITHATHCVLLSTSTSVLYGGSRSVRNGMKAVHENMFGWYRSDRTGDRFFDRPVHTDIAHSLHRVDARNTNDGGTAVPYTYPCNIRTEPTIPVFPTPHARERIPLNCQLEQWKPAAGQLRSIHSSVVLSSV